VHNISDVRQIEVHTAKPLVLGSSRLEVEIPIANLDKFISPGSDKIPAELIQIRSKILRSARNCMILGKSLLLYLFSKPVTKLAVIIIVEYHYYQLPINFYRISSSVHR
jgi:hypothetical protein